jgi:hypothetical protein
MRYKDRKQVPYQFIADYPIDECIRRLELKNGNYIDTRFTFRFEQSDAEHCRFRLNVDITARNREPDVHRQYDGLLQANGKSFTDVSLVKARTTLLTYFSYVGFAGAGLLVFIWINSNSTPIWGGLPHIISLVAVLYGIASILSSLNSGQIEDRVISMIEDTLKYHEPVLGISDQVKGKIERLGQLFGLSDKPKRKRQ